MNKSRWTVGLICITVLQACSSPVVINTTTLTSAPSQATVTSTPPQLTATCAEVDAHWGQDWPATITVLEQLNAAHQTCGAEPLSSKLYAAHFNYATTLESQSDLNAAIDHYRAAFALDPQRTEAMQALIRLQALPAPTPPTCLSSSPPNPDPASTEIPDPSQLVTVHEGGLWLSEASFKIKGVNYYPRHAPWYRFLEEADPAEMASELQLITQAGFNTLRIFLRYEPLFTCEPEQAIPNEAGFARVDTLFKLADENHLKLIVTLNDLPDLVFRPLYTDWAHYDAQTTYIVRRYRHESSILAWDLRNEGDLDYGARPGDPSRFSQSSVLDWLKHASQSVRENDPYHLLTAGWWGNPIPTGPAVDILSFHHWSDAAQLQDRILAYQAQTLRQPLLLQEVGFHSWPAAPFDPRDETGQADLLRQVIQEAERHTITGWVIWTAFDFEPEPGRPATFEHFFGLWRTDLTPKPALESLPLR